MASVVVLETARPAPAVEIRIDAGARDPDAVNVEALLPVEPVAGKDPLERGNLPLRDEEVETLQDLMDLLAHERLDPLEVDLDLLDVSEVVLLRAGLEAAQAGVAEGLLHGGDYTQR